MKPVHGPALVVPAGIAFPAMHHTARAAPAHAPAVANGGPARLTVTCQDITERKETERRVRQLNRPTW